MPNSETIKKQDIASHLALWASEYHFKDASEAVLNEAKRCLIDATGAALAGSQHPITRLLAKHIQKNYSNGECNLLGLNPKISPIGAALFNGTCSHVLDFDDVSFEGMVHATAVVWPAVLAAAQSQQTSGEDALAAFVAGVEIEYALGRAFTHDLFWRGWWTTGLLGVFGAVTGASKALGLTTNLIREAICIAACQTTSPYVLVGSQIKPFASGRAAEFGVQAAFLAKEGLTAPRDVFENPHGIINMFGDGTFKQSEINKLGDHFVLSSSGVAFKKYPVCAAAQSSVEALVNLLERYDLNKKRIFSVCCEVTPQAGHYMPFKNPQNLNEAQFSLEFCLACVIVTGGVTIENLSQDFISSIEIRHFLPKIKIIYCEKLANEERNSSKIIQPARVTLFTDDGKKYAHFNPCPIGLAARPMSNADIDEKFFCNAKYRLNEGEAKTLNSRLWNLEQLTAINALLDFC